MNVPESVKEIYKEIRENLVYADRLQSWNSGGNIIITEMPLPEPVDGMECFIVLDSDDYITVYPNRYMDREGTDAPFYFDNAVCYLTETEPVPEELRKYVRELMDCKAKYMKDAYGIDYRKQWEEERVTEENREYFETLFRK